MPLSELGPAGMKWEGKECSEEVKRRAGWAFLEHLEEFGDSGIATSLGSVPDMVGRRDPGGFWVRPVRP